MNNWKSIFPNSLTAGNLLCGVAGIIFTFNHNIEGAVFLMLLAGFLDFFDGLVARALGVSGELGKQLDSLADMTTFGVLPGIILFQMISVGYGEYFIPIQDRPSSHLVVEFLALLVPLFSMLRLAKFNIDTNQSDNFIGVPTPANAIFIASFPLILAYQFKMNIYFPLRDKSVIDTVIQTNFWSFNQYRMVMTLYEPWFYAGIAIVGSLLLVAPVKLLNFKFKNLGWKDNQTRYIFLISCLVIVLLGLLPEFIRMPYRGLRLIIIPILIAWYVLYSAIAHLIELRKK